VQLPVYGVPSDNSETSPWAIIRAAQKEALSLPATGMAAALDLGEWNDLHPLNKKDVGYRLFLAAEKTLFNVENSSPGPILRRFEKQKDRVMLFFDNCAGGLAVKDGEKAYVSVIDENDNSIRLPAAIEGADCVCIDISRIKSPKKILYAWARNPADRQLYNGEGLPVIPFKMDI
jgi:sialate O-acetylesterase